MKIDPDYTWLLSHTPQRQTLASRGELAKSVAQVLQTRIEMGALPFTIGVFGGWGVGKTTFLALLAERLKEIPDCRVIYFNSWKYAGFMEIVPSLIYKILQYGVRSDQKHRDEAAMRVLLSLGKEYSDRFGQWAENRVGINPVSLFKDVHHLTEIAKGTQEMVRPELLNAYYNQVDKAQDELAKVLGQIKPGERAQEPLIVLIDELDRCDPDEAFNVIKQMRVLFAMRQIPVAFVVCANPEPIGLAIKHRYGLESESGDYEARRILEKFVDAYEDLTEPIPLGLLVRDLWSQVEDAKIPWVLQIDAQNGDSNFNRDTMRNACGYDAMTSGITFYANLRVLKKSFDYISQRPQWNGHLLWSLWHLEIIAQIDPELRQNLRLLSPDFRSVVEKTYSDLASITYTVVERNGKRQLQYQTDKGRTLFSIFRSFFWENAKQTLNDLKGRSDPQSKNGFRLLEELLMNHRQMEFVILLFLVPLPKAPSHSTMCKEAGGHLMDIDAEFRNTISSALAWSVSA